MTFTNTRVKLASRPTGLPQPANFEIDAVEVPPLTEGQVLVRLRFISLDPAMRGWMNEGKSYIRPVQLGEVFRAGAAGEVVARRTPRLPWATS
jgi:NADPH-dependent curcumin reductase CurA